MSQPVYQLEELAALTAQCGAPGMVEVAPGDTAIVVFTSGTPGTPKGVVLTHHNLLFSAAGTDKHVPQVPDFRMVSILPLSHMFEQMVGLLMAL